LQTLLQVFHQHQYYISIGAVAYTDNLIPSTMPGNEYMTQLYTVRLQNSYTCSRSQVIAS